ncbi:pyridoxamine 5'-phosphate oxidase family protein [Nocardia crassostreae]|uniref:pyridoxamine 5'-phosphate oxidase family protein n=1 Tax=Nocardia crassostreae TaxID=53428 RepID=UPI000831B565|nr:pyridoxamine 5'-phosphate oxidase family protein [Nocardia crassostreae]
MPTPFDAIKADFFRLTSDIVWCTITTVAPGGRPRSRILHPIWEMDGDRPVGWIFTNPSPVKSRHLSANPLVAFSYWSPAQNVVQGEARTSWVDDAATKKHVWDMFTTTPPPMGYDLTAFGVTSSEDPGFTVLRLDPDRIQLLHGEQLTTGDFTPAVVKFD